MFPPVTQNHLGQTSDDFVVETKERKKRVLTHYTPGRNSGGQENILLSPLLDIYPLSFLSIPFIWYHTCLNLDRLILV